MVDVSMNETLWKAKVVGFICDIVFDISVYFSTYMERLVNLIEKYLYSPEALSYDQIQENSVHVICALLELVLNEQREQNQEAYQLLDRFISGKESKFKCLWLNNQFSTQTQSTITTVGYVLNHLQEFADFVLVADEVEEKEAREGFIRLSSINWLGSLIIYPLTKEKAKETLFKLLEGLEPKNHAWQVQSLQLLLLESVLSHFYYYYDAPDLLALIDRFVIPGLMQQHPEVQDASCELLLFIIKTLPLENDDQVETSISEISQIFKIMLKDRNSFPKRIAGAKGLASIISAIILFEIIPQYVLDAMSDLQEAMESDSSVEPVITQFLDDFWAINDGNLLKPASEALGSFRSVAPPSYIT